jgi:hypothetical protein
MMSHRPLVFINVPDQMPLSERANRAFEHAVFLFDADDPDLVPRLRMFLSRPFVEIEAAWAEKASARAALIRRYIDADTPAAGRVAAEYLLRYGLSERFFDAHSISEPERQHGSTAIAANL